MLTLLFALCTASAVFAQGNVGVLRAEIRYAPEHSPFPLEDGAPLFNTAPVCARPFPAPIDIVDYSPVCTGASSWSMVLKGYLTAPATAEYTITMLFNNRAQLLLDDEFIAQGFSTDATPVFRSGTKELTEGQTYKFELRYFNTVFGNELTLMWAYNDVAVTIIPEEFFSEFSDAATGAAATGAAVTGSVSGAATGSVSGAATGAVATGSVSGSATGSPAPVPGCTDHSAYFSPSQSQLVFGPFAGTNQLSQPGVFTVAMWISPAQVDAVERALISVPTGADGESAGWKVSLVVANGAPSVKFSGSGSGFDLIDLVAPITLNVWTHVAVSFDGQVQKLYINGVLAYTATLLSTYAFDASDAKLVVAGEWVNDDSHNVLEVTMNEVGIWHRVLSDAEITLAAAGNAYQISVAKRFTLAYVSGDFVTVYHQDGTEQLITRQFEAVADVPPFIAARC